MSEVFLARDLSTGTECALKRLRARQDRPVNLLRREFAALSRLRHPSIVGVLDFGTAPDGTPYLAMEYVAGAPADQALAPGDWRAAAEFAAQVAQGLEVLHAAGVVHGDLKPSNILVVPGADDQAHRGIRLVDFGLARLMGTSERGGGTFGYAAPEVIAGQAPTPASDLYGLGATVFALITGRAPTGNPRTDILERQRSGPPPAHELEQTGTPWPLIEFTLRLLAPDPSERPRDAREARRDLEHRFPHVRRPLAERLAAGTRVGRERELAALEQWAACTPGPPNLMLVTGPAGSGKSTLLREMSNRSQLAGRPAIRISAAELTGQGAAAHAVTRALAPEFTGNLSPSAGSARSLDLGASVDGFVDALRNRDHPQLILMDDADRLDPLSAAWIRRLLLHTACPPIRWMFALPDSGGSGDLQVLLDSGLAHEIALGPLAANEVEKLATFLLGTQAPALLVRFLWEHGGGNPGLTEELLRAAADGGALVQHDDLLTVHSELVGGLVAGPTESRLMRRLAVLSDTARRALEALAVLESPRSLGALRTMTAGLQDDDVRELIAAGVVRQDETGRVMLHPPALAPAVVNTLDAATRVGLHRTALAIPGLDARQRFRHRTMCGELAGALAEAETAFADNADLKLATEAAALAEDHDPALAARWHARAAESCRAGGHYTAAVRHLKRQLELESDAGQRSAAWVALSTAMLRAGQTREVLDIVDRALTDSPGAADRGRLLGNRAGACALLGDRTASLRDASEALAIAGDVHDALGTAVAADVLGRFALMDGRFDDAEAWTARSSQAYDEAGNELGIVRSLGTRMRIALGRGDLEEAERLGAQAVHKARECSSRLPLVEQLLQQTIMLVSSGQWSRAIEPVLEARRLAIEDVRPIEAAIATTNLAQLEGLLGNVRAARRYARAAVRLAARYQPALLAYAWRSLAQAERIGGRARRALRAAGRALAHLAESNPEEARWCRIEYGRACRSAGRWNEAEAVWNEALPGDEDSSAAGVIAAALAGRAALRRSDRALAETQAEAIQPWLSRHPSPLAEAHATLLRAELALTRSAPDGPKLAQAALVAFAGLPSPADRAHAILDMTQLVPPTDACRVSFAVWLEEAARAFERLGDRRLREQALSLLVECLRLKVPSVQRDTGLIERVSWLLSSLTDLDELMQRAMRAAVEQLGAERGVLLLLDAESGDLAPVADYGAVEPATRNEAVGYSRRVVRHVTEGGDSLLIVDAHADPRAASDSVVDMRVRSILCVPMFVDGRAVGAVYLDDSRRTHAFAEADRGMIEGFAHLMAVAIERSRRHEEVRRENERLSGENLSLRWEVGARPNLQGVIGSSAALQRILMMVENAARTNTTVLITGENGTGKELIARTLHRSSRRRSGPFIAVNCGAIPDTLIESELFGILPNVATGVRARPGKFVLASGGTLFLDEVGEMPPNLQVALLSAISSHEVTPLGGGKPVPVDVRIVAATNRTLHHLVETGAFREDLYYRLNVIEIEVPPLRERKADIPVLTRHFLEHFARQQEREVPALSPDFLATLMRSDWPGNVRELQNYVERLLAMTPGSFLRPDPPPRDLEAGVHRPARHRRLRDAVRELERTMILEALARAHGNQSQAARELGMTEQSIRYRIRKFGADGSAEPDRMALRQPRLTR